MESGNSRQRPGVALLAACVALAGIGSADTSIAQGAGISVEDAIEDGTSPTATAGQNFLDRLAGHDAPGPLTPLGERLRDIGVTPQLNMLNVLISNPSVGQVTGKYERVTIFGMGFDLDLERMAGLSGSSIHFLQLYVPSPYNTGTFGAYAGDSLIGRAGPYIPKEWHLSRLNWEQKLFDDRLEAAIGVDQAGNHFAIPLCNQGFLCQGSLPAAVGINPPPYSNLSARLAYRFTPEWTAQLGFWRDNEAFPFSTGWEGWDGDVTGPGGVRIEDPNSSLYLANLVYETRPENDPYPRRYEVMLYYNDADQTNPATGDRHKGTSGIYLGGRQTVWRASPEPTATSLGIYGSLYASFDRDNSYGLGHELNAGLILQGPFASRPFDSYSLKFIWHHLTDAGQSHLIDSNTGNYTVGPDEYLVGIDANFVLGGHTIVQPWVTYAWNVNTALNPVYRGNPKDGWGIGVNLMVRLDKILGL